MLWWVFPAEICSFLAALMDIFIKHTNFFLKLWCPKWAFLSEVVTTCNANTNIMQPVCMVVHSVVNFLDSSSMMTQTYFKLLNFRLWAQECKIWRILTISNGVYGESNIWSTVTVLNENISKYTVMLDYYCHPQNLINITMEREKKKDCGRLYKILLWMRRWLCALVCVTFLLIPRSSYIFSMVLL